MKTALFAVPVLAAALIAGCATAQSKPVDTTFDPAASTFTGWVRVSGGEFQIYAQQRQLSEPFARPCVSGALPRNAQDAAADLSGTQVTFTGKAVPWSDRGTSELMLFEGSRIQNVCKSDYVIQAQSVRVLR